jgi:hypothetical protein
MRKLEQLFPTDSFPEVLDVGGRHRCWDGARKVTTINLSNDLETPDIVGDGCNLPFPDQSIKFIYSNSVIEHVGKENQRRFAEELRRVGNAVYCQVPNRWFPFEPHYWCLFVHWIPGAQRNYLIVRYLTLWGWASRADRGRVEEYAKNVHLPSKRELREWFPGFKIGRERVLGLTKSFFVYRTEAPR